MSTEITVQQGISSSIEQVLINGDLSKLTPADRVNYYNAVCNSIGLNPLTKPFDYINLNGKLRLYATKDCTDQLRSIHNVSLIIASREVIDDIYVVTAQARTPDGRQDESTGAVPIAGLKGESKANAYMKAETKAKRRATLSICGLGLLDEIETQSITMDQQRGSNEAAQAVAERKLAEMKGGSTYQEASAIEAAKIDPEIEEMWGRMVDFKSTMETFAALKQMYLETCGNESGYYRVLDSVGGFAHANDMVRALGKKAVRNVAASMWREIGQLQALAVGEKEEAKDAASEPII